MNPIDKPSIEQKVFLVVGVALTTVCACTNLAQAWVYSRSKVVRSEKSILFLSQAVSGLIASLIPIFPIRVISDRGGSLVGENGYDACYIGHSAIILLTLLTTVCSSTILLIRHYMLSIRDNKKYSTESGSLTGWIFGISFMWMISITISLLPWGGWNTWTVHDARCHLSTLWPLSFSALVVLIISVHVVVTIFAWVYRNTHLKSSLHVNIEANRSDSESVPITSDMNSYNQSGRICAGAWLLTMICSIPLLGNVLLASSCAISPECRKSAHHYHEDVADLPWSTLFLTAAAIANPLLYIFSDDQVSSTIVQFFSRICCWWKRGRTEIVTNRSSNASNEVDVYVTNDKAHLVANT